MGQLSRRRWEAIKDLKGPHGIVVPFPHPPAPSGPTGKYYSPKRSPKSAVALETRIRMAWYRRRPITPPGLHAAERVLHVPHLDEATELKPRGGLRLVPIFRNED